MAMTREFTEAEQQVLRQQGYIPPRSSLELEAIF